MVVKTYGEPREEDGLRNHVDLVQMLDIVDLEAGTMVAGAHSCGGQSRWLAFGFINREADLCAFIGARTTLSVLHRLLICFGFMNEHISNKM